MAYWVMIPAKRYLVSERASVQVYGTNVAFEAIVRNLSETGAYLEVDKSIPRPSQGDLLHISVLLRDIDKKYDIDAEVIWRKDLGFGVHFLNKDELIKKLIK